MKRSWGQKWWRWSLHGEESVVKKLLRQRSREELVSTHARRNLLSQISFTFHFSQHGTYTATMTPVLLILALILSLTHATQEVTVELIKAGSGPPVTTSHRYSSHVTLYIKNADGSKTPSGWSTRVSDGAPTDQPFSFQPGVGLITGWTEGVLKMKEGERSWLQVPSEKGYGSQAMGSPGGGGGFYIPANSNLLFDIEILGKESEMMGGTEDL